MFENYKFKRNQKRINKALSKFKDVNVTRYIAEARLIDGRTICFGQNYKYTTYDFDWWCQSILCDDVIHTDNNTYIKTKNIVEAKFYSKDIKMIKYRYDFYNKEEYKVYYSDYEIEESMKKYSRLLCLSKIK